MGPWHCIILSEPKTRLIGTPWPFPCELRTFREWRFFVGGAGNIFLLTVRKGYRLGCWVITFERRGGRVAFRHGRGGRHRRSERRCQVHIALPRFERVVRHFPLHHKAYAPTSAHVHIPGAVYRTPAPQGGDGILGSTHWWKQMSALRVHIMSSSALLL